MIQNPTCFLHKQPISKSKLRCHRPTQRLKWVNGCLLHDETIGPRGLFFRDRSDSHSRGSRDAWQSTQLFNSSSTFGTLKTLGKTLASCTLDVPSATNMRGTSAVKISPRNRMLLHDTTQFFHFTPQPAPQTVSMIKSSTIGETSLKTRLEACAGGGIKSIGSFN
jgi:hypothetical protein